MTDQYPSRTFAWATTILAVCAFVVLAAGSYIGLYNDLSYDDLHRNYHTGKNWFQRYWDFETGRYTNGMLVLQPGIYDLAVYRSLHIANLIIWSGCLWCFLSAYQGFWGISAPFRQTLLISITLLLVMVANAPNLGEWWFWYATASYYMVGSSLFLLTLCFILRGVVSGNTVSWVIAGGLAFLAVGCNELIMFLALACTTLVMLAQMWYRREVRSVLPFAGSLAGTILVFVSPGTASRIQTVTGNSVFDQLLIQASRMFHELLPTLWAGIRYWTDDPMWLLTGACFFLAALGMRGVSRVRPGGAVFAALLSVVVLLLSATVPVLLEWKVNINDPSRYNNQAYFLFLLVVCVNSFNAGLLVPNGYGDGKRYSGLPGYALVVVALVTAVLSLSTYNTQLMFEDIQFNRPQRQSDSIAHWDRIIEQALANQETSVVVPNMIPAHTLTVYRYGPKMDPNYAQNRKWKRYKGLAGESFSKRHFDHDLLLATQAQYRPIDTEYNLYAYRDEYRNFLLAQVPEWTTDSREFCVELVDAGDRQYNQVMRDETHRNLEFHWNDNRLCTDFVNRRLYCEPYRETWFCRVPMPRVFAGEVRAKWGDNGKSIAIAAAP